MSLFAKVAIRVSDRAASERFYDTVLATLGVERTADGEWHDFAVAQATAARPPTRRLHVGFGAPSRAHVDAFWRAGVAAGYRDDGAPGPRPQYRHDYYGAFLLDPDGNSAEAVHEATVREDGAVDHLWLRVADVGSARARYEAIAADAGFRLARATRERAQFLGASGSFSLVAGEPTENVELAFAAPGGGTVEVLHRDGDAVERVGRPRRGGRAR